MPISNKARSGGPRTMPGRAVASANAMRSGVYAVQVVLPGEDAAQFEELERQLVQDFEPVGMAEAAMVHDLAVLTWKKLRIDRVEHTKMTQLARMPVIEAKMEEAFGPGWRPQAMPRIEPFAPVTPGENQAAQELLRQLNALRNAPAGAPRATAFKRKWPALYAVVQAWADDYMRDGDELIEGAVVDQLSLSDALESIETEYETVSWLWDNHDKVCQAIQAVRDGRQFDYMKTCDNEVTLRSFNDTSRAFYRTLSALRRQQEWRIRRTAISVDDVSPKLTAPALDESTSAEK